LSSCFQSSKYLNLVVYQKDTYPYSAIGPVKVLYISSPSLTEVKKEKNRKLIILSHPAIAREILKQLENYVPETEGDQDKLLVFKHHRLDFVIFRLTGKQSSTILHNVLLAHSNYSSQEKLWQSQLFGSHSNDVLNFYVKDPRLHIPKKKKNPLLNKIPDGELFNLKRYDKPDFVYKECDHLNYLRLTFP